jgi:predicted nucleotidyltransferase
MQQSEGIDASVVKEIVCPILSASPDKIMLFSSSATGAVSRESDTDLLVVRTISAGRHATTRGRDWFSEDHDGTRRTA